MERIPWNKGKRGLQVAWNKGKKLSVAHIKNLSESHKGQIPWFVKRGLVGYKNKGTFGYGRMPTLEERNRASISLRERYANGLKSYMAGKFHSTETRKKISFAILGREPWNKGIKSPVKPWFGKKRPDIAGENCYNWKGGITPINLQIRNSLEMKLWKRYCLKRDDYRCLDCGVRGGKFAG